MKNKVHLRLVLLCVIVGTAIFFSSCEKKLNYNKDKKEYDQIVNCLLGNYTKLYDSLINTPLRSTIYADDLRFIIRKCNFKADNVMNAIEFVSLSEDSTIAFHAKYTSSNITLLVYSFNRPPCDIVNRVMAKYDNRYKIDKKINDNWVYVKGNVGLSN